MRDYEKRVADGRARAYRESGPRLVRARLGPSRPPPTRARHGPSEPPSNASGSSARSRATVASGTSVANSPVPPLRSVVYITSCRGTTRGGSAVSQTYVWPVYGSVSRPRGTWATGAPVSYRTADPDGEAAPFGRGTTEEGWPTGKHRPGRVSVSTTRSHETETTGVSVVSRPAHPNGAKSLFLPRDYGRGMADGRAQACRAFGSSARSRSAMARGVSAVSSSAPSPRLVACIFSSGDVGWGAGGPGALTCPGGWGRVWPIPSFCREWRGSAPCRSFTPSPGNPGLMFHR